MLGDFVFIGDLIKASINKRLNKDNENKAISSYLRRAKEIIAKENKIDYTEVANFYEYKSDKICDFDLNEIKNELSTSKVEILYIICLNKNNQLVSLNRYSSNDSDKIDLPFSEIMKNINYKDVNKLISIHNHPSGDELFSYDDELFTIGQSTLATQIGIEYIDYLLVANNKLFSFKKIFEIYKEVNLFPLSIDMKDKAILSTLSVNFDDSALLKAYVIEPTNSNILADKSINIIKGGLIFFDSMEKSEQQKIIEFFEDCLNKMKEE